MRSLVNYLVCGFANFDVSTVYFGTLGLIRSYVFKEADIIHCVLDIIVALTFMSIEDLCARSSIPVCCYLLPNALHCFVLRHKR